MKKTADNNSFSKGRRPVDERILAEGLRVAWDNFDPDTASEIQDPDEEKKILEMSKQRIDGIIDMAEYSRGKGRLLRIWGTAAAVIVPLLFVAVVWLLMARPSGTPSDGFASVTTGAGERATVQMPDGTEVVLNSGSCLRYPLALSKDEVRRVEFSGEAYFNVARLDESVPFEINTQDVTVRVLGTSFNVLARSEWPMVEVSLDSGSVELEAHSQDGTTVSLRPGEVGLYDCLACSFRVVAMPSRCASGWLRHRLEYTGVSPDTLISDVERTYSVTIPDAVKAHIDEPFTGSLPDNDLQETMMILSKIYRFPAEEFCKK